MCFGHRMDLGPLFGGTNGKYRWYKTWEGEMYIKLNEIVIQWEWLCDFSGHILWRKLLCFLYAFKETRVHTKMLKIWDQESHVEHSVCENVRAC